MTEEEKFNNLISRDPSPGTKDRILKDGRDYLVPGWVFNSDDEYVKVTYKNIKLRYPQKFNLTGQIIYDILVLGLTSINDRPVCQVCGKPVKYQNFSNGYNTTCGESSCISENARREVLDLWKNDSYRNTQSESHVAWASIPENKDKMRTNSIIAWEDPEYRSRQSNSHKEWAAVPENKDKMRKISLGLWKDKNYRDKQVESHIRWAKENPEKIVNGLCGTIECKKSITGNIIYDSSWEKDFIIFCENYEFVKTIDRSGLMLCYYYNGMERSYFPDFIVITDKERLLVEIKADWLAETERTIKKFEAGEEFIRNHPDFSRYIVLTGGDLYLDPSCKTLNTENIIKILNSL